MDPVGGGQFKQLVKQIMEAESQPLKQMETRKAREDSRLKLFQDFKTKFAGMDKAIAEISDFQKLRELKVDMGDGESIASVTIDKARAQPGSYQIEVEGLAERSSIISNGFEHPDETSLGVGFVVMYNANGDGEEVYVEGKDATLNGVASLINSRTDLPVRASVIKDASDGDEPWKLIITAKNDGEVNAVQIPDFYFLDGDQDFYIDDDRDAKNAVLKMNGMDIETEGNTVKDFLPGINLQLKQAREGHPFTLTITEDIPKIAGKVKGVVEQMNQIFSFIVKQNQIDAKTDTSTTFAGDTGLQTIEYRFRNLMHEGLAYTDPNTGERRGLNLSQLGIEFDKAGMLQFKEDKFTKAIEGNFDAIAEALSGPNGFANKLRDSIANYTRAGNGMLAMREQGLRSRIDAIDRQIDQKNRVLERRQQALTEKFSRLQSTLGNLQSQQAQLSASMGGGGGNPISQLLNGIG